MKKAEEQRVAMYKQRMAQQMASKRAWERSEEYRVLCERTKSEAARIVSLGESYCEKILQDPDAIRAKAVTFEYAAAGNIHRGFYCPSLVYDFRVGNMNRGQLIEGAKMKKVRWRFAYDESGRMIYVDCLNEGSVIETEYLFYGETTRLGVLLDENGIIKTIAEEVFEQELIVRYSEATVYPDEHDYFCAEIRTEQYIRDEIGLYICETENFYPYVSYFQNKDRAVFERKNGYLTGYTVSYYPIENADEDKYDRKFIITVPRKA